MRLLHRGSDLSAPEEVDCAQDLVQFLLPGSCPLGQRLLADETRRLSVKSVHTGFERRLALRMNELAATAQKRDVEAPVDIEPQADRAAARLFVELEPVPREEVRDLGPIEIP